MYFNAFPIIPYDSIGDYNFKDVTNLLRRVRLRAKVKTNTMLFDTYDVKEGETPEMIADKLYGDPELHWVVLMVNDITDRFHQWPMNWSQFNQYVTGKYGSISETFQNTVITSPTDIVSEGGQNYELITSGDVNAPEGTVLSSLSISFTKEVYQVFSPLTMGDFDLSIVTVGSSFAVKSGGGGGKAYDYNDDNRYDTLFSLEPGGKDGSFDIITPTGNEGDLVPISVSDISGTGTNSITIGLTDNRSIIGLDAELKLIPPMAAVHHYEITQDSGNALTKIWIENDIDSGAYSGATAITNYEHELAEQDRKRQIQLLDPSYVSLFINEFNKRMGESII